MAAAAPATVIPRNLSVASYFATLEWIGSKIPTLRGSEGTFRVLSVENGSPEYDAEILNALRTKYSDVKCTIINPSKAYSRMISKHPELEGTVELVESKYEEFNPAEKYDFIYSSFWRGQFEDEEGGCKGMDTCLLGYLKPGGTLFITTHGTGGVFSLRTWLRSHLGEDGVGAAPRKPHNSERIRDALSEAGAASVILETIDSQVDLRECVRETLSPIGVSTLSSVLKWDVEALARHQPGCLETVIEDIYDMCLANTGFTGSCPVYAPLTALLVVAGDAKAPGAGSGGASGGAKVAEPLFKPVDLDDRVAAHRGALGTPGKVGAEVDIRQLSGSLPPETHFGAPPPPGLTDSWYPHGHRGGFFNKGLQTWFEMRASWNEVPEGFVMPPPPPPLDLDDLFHELSELRRSYEMPGPMRLPDLIELFNDIWESQA